jgi:transcriptional regulator with XRE-family HTH domain
MTTDKYISPIEWLRRRSGDTKRQISQVLQMSEAAYGRMERGGFKVSQTNMATLSKYYNVSMDIFNPEIPKDMWESFLKISPKVSENSDLHEIPSKKKSSTINQQQEEHEDLFLKNLEINTLQNQIKGLEEAMRILKKKYLDLCKENAELKKLKNHPNG